jgi:hypothetical protein
LKADKDQKTLDEGEKGVKDLKKTIICKLNNLDPEGVERLDKCRAEKLPKDPGAGTSEPPPHPCVYLCCAPTEESTWSTPAIEAWAKARLSEATKLTELDVWMTKKLAEIKVKFDTLKAEVEAAPPKAFDRAYLEVLDIEDELKSIAVYTDPAKYTEVQHLRATRIAIENAIAWHRNLACAYGKDAGVAEESKANEECRGTRTLIDDILECYHDPKVTEPGPDPTPPCTPAPTTPPTPTLVTTDTETETETVTVTVTVAETETETAGHADSGGHATSEITPKAQMSTQG